MYRMTRALRRTAVAAAVIAVLSLMAPPALAAHLHVNDARADMWSIEEGSTDPDPAPRATVGDFLRTTFRHTNTRVVVRSKFVELVPTARRFQVWVEMRDQDRRVTFALVATTPRDRDGRTLLMTGRGNDVACDIRHRVDHQQNTVRMSLPRRCLDSPRTLQFRAFSSYSARSLRFAKMDNPHNRRAFSRAWTQPVPRG